jgi:hypothetical protein
LRNESIDTMNLTPAADTNTHVGVDHITRCTDDRTIVRRRDHRVGRIASAFGSRF